MMLVLPVLAVAFDPATGDGDSQVAALIGNLVVLGVGGAAALVLIVIGVVIEWVSGGDPVRSDSLIDSDEPSSEA